MNHHHTTTPTTDPSYLALRMKAVESLLIEKGMVSGEAIDAITDAYEHDIGPLRGAGVVGEEPVLAPGASYEYTSGVPLPTPSGIMVGTYGMVTTDGKRFEIDIPAFSLDGPEAKRTLN